MSNYKAIIDQHGPPGFVYGELVRAGTHNRVLPPQRLMANIVPVLQLANELRRRMLAHGARGLRVAAAYRPTGGAANSQHRFNRALDLDLLPADYNKTTTYYREAVRLWCERGGHDGTTPIGLGLYCSAKATGGIRVHIDVGFRARTWQISGGKTLPDPLARRIAAELNIRPPADKDDHS